MKEQNLMKSTILLTITVATTLIVTSIFVIGTNIGFSVYAHEQDKVLVHLNGRKPDNADEVHATTMATQLATALQDVGKDLMVFLDANVVNLGVKDPDTSLANPTS